MPNATQFDMFSPPVSQRFEEWVHTEQGRKAADRFIKIAWGFHLRGRKIGAKAIWERLRWNHEVRKQEGDDFALNNNYTAHMARMAMDREPALRGFFEIRASKAA